LAKVFLVGAGPGDPGLITVRGLECIRTADVIVYDRLVDSSLLKEARSDAELIYVGKRAGAHTMSQEEINQVLIDNARRGLSVVRLKGGDPFIFGRGGEEALALADAGVDFEVVPGVSSAIAAAAYAGIPVTHRGLCTTLGIVAGHEDPSKPQSAVRWDKIANGLDTIVFLMGAEKLGQIASELVANGRDADTPVAVIEWGTLPRQKTVVGTLANIAENVRAAGLNPPVVIVVGEIVRLREKLRWFDTKPLFGKKILVTRSEDQAEKLSEALRYHGAEPIEFPVIRIEPPSSFAPLDTAIERMCSYDWLLFTSVNGVSETIKRLAAIGRDVRALAGPKIGAIGPATAQALSQLGIRVDYVPRRFVAEAFCDDFPEDPAKKRILIIRAEEARNVLPEGLAARGAVVSVVAAYKTEVNFAVERLGELCKQLEGSEIDVVTFTSSSTVSAFLDLVGSQTVARLPDSVKIACIGPVTASTAREYGLNVHIVAQEYTVDGLVAAIVEDAKRNP